MAGTPACFQLGCAVQICFGWGVGISRYINSKHNVSDIIGGFMLGAMFGLVFVLRVRTTRGSCLASV